jgi:hypothetical protein
MADNRAGGPATHTATNDFDTRILFGSAAPQIAMHVVRVHEQLLMATERLSDEQLAWSPNVDAPPIQFHLWHIARYADRFRSPLRGSCGCPTSDRAHPRRSGLRKS